MGLVPLATDDPGRCPLCGQPNTCAMETQRASGIPQGPCWCRQVDFAADLLARVPVEARGRSCICPACARSPQDRTGQ
jgi:hypothetical protein